MKILIIHNFYGTEAPSGENRVVEMEMQMLGRHGHTVEIFARYSDDIRKQGLWGKIKGGLVTPWNWAMFFAIRRKINQFKPDVVHVHNTFPLISPSVFWGIPRAVVTVMTLHNYRIVCPAALPIRGGKVCTLCIETRSVFNSFRFGCYRNSKLATVPLAVCVAFHRWIRTWQRVNIFIALNKFHLDLMFRCGWGNSVFGEKSNFLAAQTDSFSREKGDFCVYVGRLSQEKGIVSLIHAWRLWGNMAPLLKIIGDGDLRLFLEKEAAGVNVLFLGQKVHTEVYNEIASAKLLVLPSECYECFPMVVPEAFSVGTPIGTTDLGPLPSIVEDGVTGVIFPSNNPQRLYETVSSLWDDKEKLSEMGRNARREYEAKYTEEANYRQLMEIYKSAFSNKVI